MNYPNIGDIVHTQNVTKCDKCWRNMWDEVITFKCVSCHKRVFVECEQTKSTKRCIGYSKVVC